MQFIRALVLPLTAAVAVSAAAVPQVAAAAESIEIVGGVRVQRSGQPTTLHFEFNDHAVNCDGGPIPDVLPSASFACSDPAYSFSVLAAPTLNRYSMEIRHKLDDGAEVAGQFLWGCNGPLPTICSQIGIITVDLA